jgi:hypothetical protein
VPTSSASGARLVTSNCIGGKKLDTTLWLSCILGGGRLLSSSVGAGSFLRCCRERVVKRMIWAGSRSIMLT